MKVKIAPCPTCNNPATVRADAAYLAGLRVSVISTRCEVCGINQTALLVREKVVWTEEWQERR